MAMTAEPKKIKKLTTPRFQISFPWLFKPRPGQGEGAGKYEVNMLFPPGTKLQVFEQAVVDCAVAEWGEKAKEDLKAKRIKHPFKDQGLKAGIYEGYREGGIFFTCRSGMKPGVVNPDTDPVIDPEEAYPGRWAIATINPFTYNHATGGRGVSFGLNNIQLLEHAPRWGAGRSTAKEDFKPVEIDDNGEAELDDDAVSSLFG